MKHLIAASRGKEAWVKCATRQHACFAGAALTRQRISVTMKQLASRTGRQTTQAMSLVTSFVFCLMTSAAFAAEGMRPAFTPVPPPVSTGSMVQIIFSLLLVLAAIVLVAWLLKRMNMVRQGSVNLLKVVGGVAIGQRERVVLVEIKDTWLVVGVGPGQIRTLHTLQKTEVDSQTAGSSAPGHLTAENRFSRLLSKALVQRNQDTRDR